MEIVSDNTAFLKTQKYLQSELKEIKNGDTVFHEIDELDKRLETIIRKNETIISKHMTKNIYIYDIE